MRNLFLLPVRLLTLLFLILALSPLYAQKINEDSLRNILRESKNDSIKVLVMRKLANYQILHKGEEEAGLKLLDEAETLARKINLPIGICEILMTRGNYHYRKSDWTNAIRYFTEVQEQSSNIIDTTVRNRTKMMALNNLAGIYSKNGDYTTALDYYFKSRELLEKIKPDYSALCTVYVNIASHYSILDQNEKAAEYLDKCAPLLDSAKSYLRYLYWSEKQGLANKQKNGQLVKAAIDSLESSLSIMELSDYEMKDYSLSLYEMKANYQADYLKNFPEAIKQYENKLAVATELENSAEVYNSLLQIGECHVQENNLTKAMQYLQKAYIGAKKDSIMQVVYLSAKSLGKIYYKQKDYDKAYQFSLEASQVNDSIISQKNLAQLNFLEAGYQNEKKEKTIAELKLSNAEKALAVNIRSRQLLIVGISLSSLLLVLGLLYRSSRQKRIIAEKDRILQQDQIKFLERQQQIVSLQSMINGQETERTRIAKDLHDGLGGLFSTIKMHFSTLQHENQELKTNALFTKSYDMVNTASEEVRRIAHNMMPEVLIKLGLVQASKDLCNSISAGKLLDVSMQSYGMEKRLNASTEIMLFRIIQELLNNIMKHANATEALIQFNREGNRLSITVEDNGRGFNLQDADNKTHAGLESVQSRVSYLNGKFSIDSQKEIGTTVMMDFLINE
jgi:two-component system NarL family sensor kinase